MAMRNAHWTQAAAELSAAGAPYVLATVLATQGSTPRGAGTKMVVTADHSYGSIGGGALEFRVMQRARELLAGEDAAQEVQGFPLGAAGQCCGGSVSVLFECFPATRDRVVLFGAGHVARALLRILAELPLQVTVLDTRPELIEPLADLPGVQARCVASPVAALAELPAGSHVLVLTHDHALDFELASALLADWRWASAGVIGSDTKAARFRARLAADGFSPEQVERLACPVGDPRISGKQPMAVAVSIAAQLLAQIGDRAVDEPRDSLDWRGLRRLLSEGED